MNEHGERDGAEHHADGVERDQVKPVQCVRLVCKETGHVDHGRRTYGTESDKHSEGRRGAEGTHDDDDPNPIEGVSRNGRRGPGSEFREYETGQHEAYERDRRTQGRWNHGSYRVYEVGVEQGAVLSGAVEEFLEGEGVGVLRQLKFPFDRLVVDASAAHVFPLLRCRQAVFGEHRRRV